MGFHFSMGGSGETEGLSFLRNVAQGSGSGAKRRIQWADGLRRIPAALALRMESTMKTVAEDKDTITIQFTRTEARNLRSATNYISDLFEYRTKQCLVDFHF